MPESSLAAPPPPRREASEIAGRVENLAAVLASGTALTPRQLGLLEAFSVLVRRWSGFAGLMSKGDLPHFADRHLQDSLMAAEAVRAIQEATGQAGLRLVDLGSGAGLPGVPLAVALPEVAVTLVERSAKKARFLNRVRRELDLPNVDVRCVDLADLPASCCDIATARALMPPAALWRSARAMLRPGGRLLAFAELELPPGEGAEGWAPQDFPGGSIGRTPRGGGLLVVRKDDPNHSGGQPERRRRQDHDER